MKNPSKDEKIHEYEDNSERVARGGSRGNSPNYMRASYRSYNDPSYQLNYLGFRIVRNSNEKSK
jgi:formylglycine-generating enzyme required for sulfatase activity